MIIDRLENAERYFALNPGFAAGFAYLRRPDLAQIPTGSHPLEGERLRADVIQAPAKTLDQLKLEVHRRYIDVQYLLSGEESFGWKLTAECTQATQEYDPVKDRIFYTDEPQAYFPLPAGMFAIFFPEDAHSPMLGAGTLHKVVLKVQERWEG
ncbi:MAG TPA: YhcH/YjgK/YiaL family protein [Armatimonadota bacterium]|jgi:YhcH/YjgK/YiaL family protein